jgi:hypothetical protein
MCLFMTFRTNEADHPFDHFLGQGGELMKEE